MPRTTYENRRVLVGKCGADWLTFTSFDMPNIAMWGHMLIDALGDKKDGRIMQYDGSFCGDKSGFYGVGEQVKKGETHAHGYMKISGYNAIGWHSMVNESGLKLSRVDSQITVDIERPFDMSGVCYELRNKGVKAGIRSDKYSDGTLYIGSRKSHRFGRIYMKDTREGMCLRCEVQMEKEYAKQYQDYSPHFTQSQASGIALRWLWKKMSDSGTQIFDDGVHRCRHIANMSANGGEFEPIIREQEHDTLRWLETVVDSAVGKLAIVSCERDYRRLERIIEGFSAHMMREDVDK